MMNFIIQEIISGSLLPLVPFHYILLEGWGWARGWEWTQPKQLTQTEQWGGPYICDVMLSPGYERGEYLCSWCLSSQVTCLCAELSNSISS